MKIINLIGQRFGRLSVMSKSDNLGVSTAWKCLCSCGLTKIIRGRNLKSGQVISCGCNQDEHRRNGDHILRTRSIEWIKKRFDTKWTRLHAFDCWLWLGYLDVDGYGSFNWTHRKRKPAHRASWELYRGQIPDRLTIDHLCLNKSCVNPSHMELVTGSENTKRYWRQWRVSGEKHDSQ